MDELRRGLRRDVQPAFVDDAGHLLGRDIGDVRAGVVAGLADLLERDRVVVAGCGDDQRLELGRSGLRIVGGDLLAVPQHRELGVAEIGFAHLEVDLELLPGRKARDRLGDLDVARARLEVDHRGAVGRDRARIPAVDALELDIARSGAADRRGRVGPALDEALVVGRAERGAPRAGEGEVARAAAEVAVDDRDRRLRDEHRHVVGDVDLEVVGERHGIAVEVDGLDEAG